MKISQEVRDYSKNLGKDQNLDQGLTEKEIAQGMKEKSEEFKALGSNVYVNAAETVTGSSETS